MTIVFDTETTGLPKTKTISKDTLELWPHIVQLSFINYDNETNAIITSYDTIIKVDETVVISEESTQIHGITKEMSLEKGEEIIVVLNEFFKYLEKGYLIVGHNVSFDLNMVHVELLRLIYQSEEFTEDVIGELKNKLELLLNYKNIYCTMQESIELCDIKKISKFGKTTLKWPKLIELHQKLFDTTPKNLHNSYNDILTTLRCFVKIKYDNDLLTSCDTFQSIADTIELY
jgi:DNA polymerase III epsilon subunit-like protein